ncbi:hypothetical protein [Capsulimonas corticalis]|uniref:hypothetical protein n=1 Tax=Capsulimonas corticalis TaxID=2219043 RepID=UPI000E64A8CB|nr:hypothetical protein [Capsulimonas corticalis]
MTNIRLCRGDYIVNYVFEIAGVQYHGVGSLKPSRADTPAYGDVIAVMHAPRNPKNNEPAAGIRFAELRKLPR